MLYLIKFIYHFFLPPGIFVLLLFALAVWIYRYHKKGAVLTALVALCLYAVSTPFTGDVLVRSLENVHQPPGEINADVIVVLGGGATPDTPNIEGKGHLSGSAANRVLTGARLQKDTGLPVILSGGIVYEDSGNEAQIARRYMVDLGVEEEKIIIENKSRNTTENARYTAGLMEEKNFKKAVLVTSAFHMRRSVMNFQDAGVPVQPYPTDYMAAKEPGVYPNNFVPSHGGLYQTGLAAKEYLGITALKFQ